MFFRVIRDGQHIVRIEQLETEWTSQTREEQQQLQQAIRTIARRDKVDVWEREYNNEGLSGAPTALKKFLLDIAKAPLHVNRIYSRIE
jgi:hypothetical protein